MTQSKEDLNKLLGAGWDKVASSALKVEPGMGSGPEMNKTLNTLLGRGDRGLEVAAVAAGAVSAQAGVGAAQEQGKGGRA